MTTVTVTVRGTTPLLMDAMSKETLMGLISGVRPPIVKDRTLEAIAADKIYREGNDPKGAVGLPAKMLFSCLNGAGRLVKNGKKAVATAKSSNLPAYFSIDDLFLKFPVLQGQTEPKWEADATLGRLPKDGTAIGIVRPMFKDWGFTVNVRFDEKLINEKTIRALFDEAGRSQGLGAFRPNCKGQYGKFEVKEWAAKKLEAPVEQPVAA